MSGVALHWFRKGLRLHDNKALLNAIQSCRTLIPLYILDTEYLDVNKVGVNRMAFVLETLKCLDDDLREKGSRLFVAKGNPVDVIKQFIRKFDVEKFTFERDTEPYNRVMDEEMMTQVKELGVQIEEAWGHTLFNPDYLLNLNKGKAPLTMNGFLKLASTARAPEKPLDAPDEIPGPPSDINFDDLDVYNEIPMLADLNEFGYKAEDKTTWFVAGEKEAMKRMEDFLKQRKRVVEFEKPKTDPTALVPDTTALSPYLARGSLSVRLFYYRLKDTIASANASKPPVSLEGQIYWREMAYLVGYSTPNFHKMVGNPVCTQIPWLEGDKALELVKKWEMGQTGYPAVDAAMAQLRTEGWMHHLARHLVACFLTRGDLWVTWELGRDVFDKYLVDADWSINNFSWHWLSCSAFFHQYWRCYGPTTFFKKTDSRGLYIRKHLPFLKKYPDKFIYEPWNAPKNIQEAAKCIIGTDYPKPIVDHSIVSKDNMDRMKEAYAKAKSLAPPPAKKSKAS